MDVNISWNLKAQTTGRSVLGTVQNDETPGLRGPIA